MSQNSYLYEFCARVSQIVFLANLAVLWFITTVSAKISQNSYIRQFYAQVSQIVFLAALPVLRLIYNCMSRNVTKLKSRRVLCTNVTNRVLSWFDRFTVITTLWAKMSQNSYFYEFCAQVSRVVLLADLTVLGLIYNCMRKNVTKLISPRVLCTNVTNRVHSWFDRFTFVTTLWAKMSQKSYLREFCAQVSQIVFLADLTILQLITTVWPKMSPSSYLSETVHKYQKSSS